MSEEQEYFGHMTGFEIKKQGVTNGKDWAIRSYKIDGKSYDSIKDFTAFVNRDVKFKFKSKSFQSKDGQTYQGKDLILVEEVTIPTETVENNEMIKREIQANKDVINVRDSFKAAKIEEDKRRFRSMSLAYAKDLKIAGIIKEGCIKGAVKFFNYIWEGDEG